MAMTVYVQLTAIGADAGPTFDLFANGDSYTSAFATDIDSSVLLSGATYNNVPDDSTIIRIMSHNNIICQGHLDLSINIPTTTTTTTVTVLPTTTTTTTAPVSGSNLYSVSTCDNAVDWVVDTGLISFTPFSDYIQFQLGTPGIGAVICGQVMEDVTGVGEAGATLYSNTPYGSCEACQGDI